MLQAGGLRGYTHTYIGQSREQGQANNNINFMVFSIQMEAWHIWQTGQHRQLGHSFTGVSEQQPKGIFFSR